MSMVSEMKLYIKKMDGTVVTYKIDKVCPLDNKILAFELNKKLTLEYELTYSYEVWWLLIRLNTSQTEPFRIITWWVGK